jgi:hypothetical protein
MDPLTVASAVALLILTKAVEKTGDKLGEKVVQSGNELWQSLRQRKPETAGEIVKIAESSDLSRSEALSLDAPTIISDIQQLANEDADFRRSVETAAQQWQVQSGGITNSSKIAEKIGVLNQGLILNQQNTLNF